MTISSSTRKAGPYTGNGITTVFSFSFKVFAAADLQVVRTALTGVESTLVLGTDYTVSLNSNQNSNPGGNVTILSTPAVGILITITSSIAYTQQLDLTNQGGFYPTTINDALDRATIQIQQLNEQVGRSAKLPISSTADATTLVTDILLLANDITNLNAVAGDLTNINTVAGNTTNINTVAGNNTNVTNVGGSISNVNTVAASIANVNTVAGNNTNVTNVGGSITNVNTVGGAIANVNTNASNIASINTNASNITAIQNASANATAAATSATNAATSATNAATSATAAANSATAAAAAAASGLYRQVLDKTANYTVVAADQGTLFRMNTGSGSLTVTLPQISTVTDGFKVSIVKWTGDANTVTINRSGSDTINGATSATIGAQYSQTTFVADFETNTWFAASSGLGSTNVVVDVFSGNNSTTAFTLSGDPGTKNNTWVHIGGVYQNKSTYSQSGTTITFSTAPPSGTSNIEIVWTQPLSVGVPSDGTVNASKLDIGSSNGTGATKLPTGTTAQRPVSPAAGYTRYNTDTNQFEGYNGSAWTGLGGGATGAGGDAIFVQNGQTVNNSYTIPAGLNASSVGPITIATGKAVTISSGSRWVIL